MTTRDAVRAEVTSDLDRLVADVVATIREQIPAYSTLTPAQVDEVRAITAWATTRVLELWAEGGELSDADVQRFRGIGAARALDGRPLPVILRAYRVAGSRITDLVVEAGGTRLTVPDTVALARLWMSSIDTLSEALYAGHSAAADRVAADRDRALADLLDDLLAGRQATRTALADRCRELGITLPRTVSVIATAGPVTPGGALLTRLRDGTGVALLAAPPAGPGESGRIGGISWTGPRACVVTARDTADVPRAHRLAELGLRSAPARAFADRPLLDEADAQVVALLATQRDADPARLTALALGAIESHPHLLEGLDAFLAAGSATAASALLDVHAQTMRYRLRRIVELTGRDPRRPWDRFVLEVARTVP